MPHFIHFFSKKDILMGIFTFLVVGGSCLWVQSSRITALSSAMLITAARLSIVYVYRLKQMLNTLKNAYNFKKICHAIHNSDEPESLICEVFGTLTADEKLRLLIQTLNKHKSMTHKGGTHLDWLLRNPKENRLILESLVKGLSAKQRLEAISHISYDNSTFLKVFLAIWEQVPVIFERLLENMNSQDKFQFLMMRQNELFYQKATGKIRPIFIVFMDSAINNFCDNKNDPNRDSSLVDMLDFLFKGLSLEELTPLLAVKWPFRLYKNDPIGWKWCELTTLELALDIKSEQLINLFIRYRALEIDPEYIPKVLDLGFTTSITFYRDSLKARLQESKCFKAEVIKNIICDYLIGESASKLKVEA